MILKVQDVKTLKEFIYFPKTLYANSKEFCHPIYSSLIKELKHEVLKTNNYTALLYKENGKILARIMYTVTFNNKLNKNVCYFSFFDAVNDINAVKQLFSYLENDVKEKTNYIEGTFSPYDPDTRRGVLIKGYDEPHTLFTSYNYSYYGKLLEALNYTKAYDTFTIKVKPTAEIYSKIERIAKLSQKKYGVEVKSFSYKNLKKDLSDVHKIMSEATTELNYQEAPSFALIYKSFKSLRFFINPKLVKIARINGEPVGFSFTILDYNEVLSKTNGKINLFTFFKNKNKITRCRGMLQYVIPKYQMKGTLAQLINETYSDMNKLGITYFEGGTILEENTSSYMPYVNLGGEISKIYRIYKKEL